MIGLLTRKELRAMATPRRSILFVLAILVAGSLVLAGAALGLTSHKTTTKPVYQQKCQNGAVKAIAIVHADQNLGFMKDYTGDASLFTTRWTCSAKAVIQARRFDRGVYDVRVLGLPGGGAGTPVVTPLGGNMIVTTVDSLPDGGWRVTLIGSIPNNNNADQSFVIVLL